MHVTVNGVPAELGPDATVATVVHEKAAAGRVAVAVNGEVVPRSRWETTDLAAGDTIEVLAPTAGG